MFLLYKANIIQPWQKRYITLLNKHYINRLTLSKDNIPYKLFKSLGLWYPNRYEIDLSNEVLNIDFGQGAAKISEFKVGVWKKYLPISLVRAHAPGVSRVGRYFFRTQTLTSNIFAFPWLKSIFSTSFERSISYLFGDQSPRLLNDI